MLEGSFAAAFIGGVLSLLSPCSSLLLPAFFAYAFQNKRELTIRTGIFFLGLSSIFVPLGMGASLATSLFQDHRGTMIIVAGVVLIAFGVMELLGRTFSFGRVGGAGGVQESRGLFGSYVLGLVYGFGGFCSGPILGSVLTVAATDDNVARGGGLLATYALGTVVPLFLLAIFWDRFKLGEKRWLRGRGLMLGPITVHSTQAIAGVIFIVLGLAFILLEGTTSLAGVYESWGFTELSFKADTWARDTVSVLPDTLLLAILGGAAAAVGVWYFLRRMRASDREEGAGPTEETLSEHDSA